MSFVSIYALKYQLTAFSSMNNKSKPYYNMCKISIHFTFNAMTLLSLDRCSLNSRWHLSACFQRPLKFFKIKNLLLYFITHFSFEKKMSTELNFPRRWCHNFSGVRFTWCDPFRFIGQCMCSLHAITAHTQVIQIVRTG